MTTTAIIGTLADGQVRVWSPAPQFIGAVRTARVDSAIAAGWLISLVHPHAFCPVGSESDPWHRCRLFTDAEHAAGAAVLADTALADEAAAVELLKIKDVSPGVADIVVCDTADLYPDGPDGVRRRFRNCWRRVGAGLPAVDMPLARAQRLVEIRTERDRRFAAFDREWTKAMGVGATASAAAIDAKRQQLRDVPQAAEPILATLTTPEALVAWEPTWPTAP